MSNFVRIGELLGFSLLLTALFGTVAFYGEFVRLHWGPLFVLDGLYLAALVSAAASIRLKKVSRILIPVSCFFIWGAALWGYDFFIRRPAGFSGRDWERFFQHGILFLYPFLWMAAGLWASQVSMPRALGRRTAVQLLAFVVFFASAFRSGVFWFAPNVSIGPVLGILIAISIFHAWFAKERSQKIKSLTLAAGAAVLTVLPIIETWRAVAVIQRTPALLLFFYVLATIFCLLRRQGRLRFLAVGAFTGLVLGLLVTGGAHKIRETWYHEGVESQDGGALAKQSPIRDLWWRTAVKDWSANPVFGIGFIPEVPSIVAVTPFLRVNGWDIRSPETRPISGPHNSYLSILARMGLIGFAIWIWVMVDWAYRTRSLWNARIGPTLTASFMTGSWAEIALLLVPIAGAIHAFFNVGLESPHNCAVMYLFAGAALGIAPGAAKKRK